MAEEIVDNVIGKKKVVSGVIPRWQVGELLGVFVHAVRKKDWDDVYEAMKRADYIATKYLTENQKRTYRSLLEGVTYWTEERNWYELIENFTTSIHFLYKCAAPE